MKIITILFAALCGLALGYMACLTQQALQQKNRATYACQLELPHVR